MVPEGYLKLPGDEVKKQVVFFLPGRIVDHLINLIPPDHVLEGESLELHDEVGR